MKKTLIRTSINHPKVVILIYVFITLGFIAALPSIQTDTDPVNMLDQKNRAVVLYNQMKDDFRFNDVVVVGIQQMENRSLFTVEALSRIHQMTMEISQIAPEQPKDTLGHRLLRKLQWFVSDESAAKTAKRIIIKEDIISPSTVDNIFLNEEGELSVRPLMMHPPETEDRAQSILKVIRNNLILKGKLASDDGSLVGIFVPIEKGMKSYSYYIGERIRQITEKYAHSDEKIHLAGLPIAETTFGIEMFIQMAVYAPAAGLLIFLLMGLFFKNIRMISGPLILAMITVVWAMGGLIYSGNSVHIMSSMIPIFLMPIALLDSIHIISHLHDKITIQKSKQEIIWEVMDNLFNPMLFTSLTTMVGFMSLSITGIQPVKVFGITIGCGVFAAWFLSMTLMPAYIVLIDFEKLKQHFQRETRLTTKVVATFHSVSMNHPGKLVLFCLLIAVVSALGIQKITVNDNPVRWFKADHQLRQADQVMNRKLAGTYMTNLVLKLPIPPDQLEEESDPIRFDEEDFFEEEINQKRKPDLRDAGIIRYMEKVQNFLLTVKDAEGDQVVGAATSLVDILREVGKTALNDSTIPLSRDKIAQYMFLFESGDLKRGKDLWKYITLDFRKAQIWLQLKNGDNQTMDLLMRELDGFMSRENQKPPVITLPNGETLELSIKWTGLTYINSVWQDEMVKGMSYALLGSFVIVFLMMTILFRSVLWGTISMLPLSLSIVFIYGLIGWIGKYYDMPIAVLSSLALGLSIDFAIHFNQSFRERVGKTKNIAQAFTEVFQEPSLAIWRNVLVLSIGFLPLLFAQLVPYVTVGVFFFLIMMVSGATSLMLLPSLIFLLKRWLPGVREFVS